MGRPDNALLTLKSLSPNNNWTLYFKHCKSKQIFCTHCLYPVSAGFPVMSPSSPSSPVNNTHTYVSHHPTQKPLLIKQANMTLFCPVSFVTCGRFRTSSAPVTQHITWKTCQFAASVTELGVGKCSVSTTNILNEVRYRCNFKCISSLQYLRFSQCCCWGLGYLGLWLCVIRWDDLEVLKDRSNFVLKNRTV